MSARVATVVCKYDKPKALPILKISQTKAINIGRVTGETGKSSAAIGVPWW